MTVNKDFNSFLYFLAKSITLMLLNGFILNACKKESNQQIQTFLSGTLRNQQTQESIFPAYIISGSQLLAFTDTDGNYRIEDLAEGNYTFTYSALGFSDFEKQVLVKKEDSEIVPVELVPNDSEGKVIGEFQDKYVFNDELVKNPDMADWDQKQIHDGTTGATIQEKNGAVIQGSKLYLGDSLLAIADEYGQYWFQIQSGTYPFTISCAGYQIKDTIIKVEADTKKYINFYLLKE